MPWVKLTTAFVRHPKVARGGANGIAMEVAALCWCNEALTDGHVPHTIAVSLVPGMSLTVAKKTILGLVERGRWEREGDGYRIHDYLKFQPSRADALALRKRNVKAAQTRWAGANGDASGMHDALHDASTVHSETHATRNAACMPGSGSVVQDLEVQDLSTALVRETTVRAREAGPKAVDQPAEPRRGFAEPDPRKDPRDVLKRIEERRAQTT